MQHARVLSVDIGVRPAGSEGEIRAATYIERVWRAAGLEVTRREFTRPDGPDGAAGGVSHNIVARIRGVSYEADYVIVGAHYDTVARSPGGNDNASGTAVVMVLGELLRATPVPVEFVAFAAEERQPNREHHLGSEAYAVALGEPRPGAMISIDMVGNGPTLLIGRLRGTSRGIQDELAGAAKARGVPHRLVVRGDVSDHGPFAKRRIPAGWLWSGDHPDYHTPRDRFELVQPEALGRAGTVMLAWFGGRFGVRFLAGAIVG